MKSITSSFSATAFPYQKRSSVQKSRNFFKECVDAGAGLSSWSQDNFGSSSIRASRKNKIVNYNLLNNIVDPVEAKRTTDPFDIRFENAPTEYRNYPLVNPNISLLVGEERKRMFRPQFVVTSPDAVNEKLTRISQEFNERVTELIVGGITDEALINKALQEFERWRVEDYRDVRERMANQTIQYLYHSQNLKEEFSRGFEDLLAVAEEMYVIDIIGREPKLRRGNPINFYTLRGGESYRIEDNEIIVEDGYLPPGECIDRFKDELSSNDITKIEGGYGYHMGAKKSMFKEHIKNEPIMFNDLVENVGIGSLIELNKQGATYFGGSFDQEGNVRVTRVVWKGMRKIKILSYYDEDDNYVEDIMPENYEVKEHLGEMAEEKWITEWYEGTRIAEDIYVRMQPVQIQIRTPDNLAASNPGIVGSTFNINSFQARSMVDMTKEYQYLYNKIMNRTELAISKYLGKVGKLNMAMKPDGWGVDEWLYYLTNMNILFEDPFNEAQKGPAQGKIAGSLSQTGNQTEIGDADFIQRHIEILAFLERRVDEITGITPQRKGAIDNRETVGGIERAVMQSSHITEKWFGIHDDVRIRALTALLEAAKVAWSDKSFIRTYVLDDQTEAILDFDSHLFSESSYGGYLTSDSDNDNILEQMRALAQPMLQNGASMSMVAELYRTKNIGDLQRKISKFEQQLQERAEEARREELEAEQAAADAEREAELLKLQMDAEQQELDRELEMYIAELDSHTKIRIAEMKAGEGTEDNTEIEREKLRTQERIKEKEARVKKEIEDKKLTMEKRKLEAQKEIQKLKDKAAAEREKIKAKVAARRKSVSSS